MRKFKKAGVIAMFENNKEIFQAMIAEYIKEIKESALEANETANDDLFQAGRNLGFIEAVGVLRRYFMLYLPDIDEEELGFHDRLEEEMTTKNWMPPNECKQ